MLCGIFPLILLFGASGKITDPYTDRIKYVGSWAESPTPYTWCITRSSNLYYAWVKNRDSFHPNALTVIIGSILLSWVCLKFYDELIRSFLAKHFLKRKTLPKETPTIQESSLPQ